MKIIDRLQHAWNAFTKNDRTVNYGPAGYYGASYPVHTSRGGYSKSKFASVMFNRIALDVAVTHFQHVKIDDKTDDREPITNSGLHNVFNVEANMDQTHIQFIQDIVYSMFDEGVVAVVPVDTTVNPEADGSYDIKTMRVGQITQWYPSHVKVSLYNEKTGRREEVFLQKNVLAIIENPLYAVVNGPNSTLTRLLNKMNLVDNMDEILSSGRLDILIQLPYALKTETKKKSAEERIKAIDQHLTMGKNGIAYIDGTEKVVQLNRPANSQIYENVKLLKEEFYNQLGLTQAVLDGTATESEMRLYYSRSVDPIVESILAEFNRKFISKHSRTKGYKLEAYRDTFNLVPVQQIAELSDTLRRNQVLTPNEIRKMLGFRPHNDPAADMLYNPNMPLKDQPMGNDNGSITPPSELEELDPAMINRNKKLKEEEKLNDNSQTRL